MQNDDWLKEIIIKLDGKLDKLDQKVDSINQETIKNTLILEEHQRRSEANEKSVELLKIEIKPLRTHVEMIHLVLKIIGIIATISSAAAGVIRIFNL